MQRSTRRRRSSDVCCSHLWEDAITDSAIQATPSATTITNRVVAPQFHLRPLPRQCWGGRRRRRHRPFHRWHCIVSMDNNNNNNHHHYHRIHPQQHDAKVSMRIIPSPRHPTFRRRPRHPPPPTRKHRLHPHQHPCYPVVVAVVVTGYYAMVKQSIPYSVFLITITKTTTTIIGSYAMTYV